MIREISKNQVLDRIRFENPWWIDGEIEADYNEMPRRLYFELFKPLVKEREIRRAVVLMGPRRVGKTVMLYHMVQELIENGVDRNNDATVGFRNTSDYKEFLDENGSDVNLDLGYKFNASVNQTVANEIFAGNKGDVFGPYKDQGFFNICSR